MTERAGAAARRAGAVGAGMTRAGVAAPATGAVR